jgi:hypothetical protein
MKPVIKLVLTIVFIWILPDPGQTQVIELLGDFKEGWQKDWQERKFGVKPTRYEVSEEDTSMVLTGSTLEGASAMWRMLTVQPGRYAKLNWRWRVRKLLSDNTPQRSKTGDDYAARVYVVFEPHIVNWKTRAICYVWSANEPVGATYQSPYASTVMIMVLQSGKENKNKWIKESRDVVADYKSLFKEDPEMITGVAIMVDADNSMQEAVAWFDDLKLNLGDPQQEEESKKKRIMFEY